jgi:DNA-directed RNA polymerase specialized sigma24 family protein
VLVARYTLPAHRTAFLLGAGEEADDVVQEAFVKAFRHLSRFRAGEPFGPWLLRIVANETRNLTRSRRRRAALTLRLGGPDIAAPDGPVDEVLAAERRAGRGPAPPHHRQHPALGNQAGRAAPGRQLRREDRARHRPFGPLGRPR